MKLNKIKFIFVVLITFSLVGCVGLATVGGDALTGVDGILCVGEIKPPPKGFVESDDEGLLKSALGASGEGKLCVGKVFLAKQPVTVYRVWNSDKSYTVYGGWWSFNQPKGPKKKYREENEICPSWSALDRMSSCTIKVGTKIVVGPGQSAQCKTFTYPKSAVNQVYVPNNARNNVILVENCTEGVTWP